jgi:hypothetical protein
MMSLFEANYEFSPRTNWPEAGKRGHDNIRSTEVFQDWTAVLRELQVNLDKTQTRQRKWCDKKRLPATEYDTLEDVAYGRAKVADKVMFS